MKLGMPYALNEMGGRSNQEDSIFPAKGDANSSSRLFLVCDGMGGHENGEVASGVVCSTFGSNLANIDHDAFTVDMFNFTLSAAYDALDREDSNPESQRKMGTTLTMLHINNHEAVIAHMGDSRVYHVRPSADNAILYQTSDHSLVNELLRAEVITPEEAVNHPRRNVITRAMQPHLETRHNAEVYTIKNVQAGDYFFLCSDGVLESLSNEALVEILRRDVSDGEKIDAIKALCEASSRDNFSAYLVPVVEGLPYVEPIVVTAELVEDEEEPQSEDVTVPPTYADKEDLNTPKRRMLTPMNITLLCVAIGAVITMFFVGFGNGNVTVELNVNDRRVPLPKESVQPSFPEKDATSPASAENVESTDEVDVVDTAQGETLEQTEKQGEALEQTEEQGEALEQTEQTEQTETIEQPIAEDAPAAVSTKKSNAKNSATKKRTLLNGMK